MKLIDLTQPWGDRMPTWPQFASIEVTDTTTHHRDGKSTVLVKTNMHTGTHIDAPIHYSPTGRHLGEIPIQELFGTALVIDLRSLVPLDRETILSSVRRTHRVLVVHEAVKRGGYGAEIAAMVVEEAFDDLDAPPRRLAGLETPIPYAEHLEKGVMPQVDDIVATAKGMVS